MCTSHKFTFYFPVTFLTIIKLHSNDTVRVDVFPLIHKEHETKKLHVGTSVMKC